MATYKPKKKIDKNGTLDDIKFPMDSVDGLSDEFKKKGVHFISDSDITVTAGSSNLSEKWAITGVDGITEPFDGMIIAIRMPSRGLSQRGVVLSIDGGNSYNSLLITEKDGSSVFYYAYQSQSTILFSFNAVRAGTAYLESGVATSITGCWQTADRDNNYIVNQQKDSADNEKPILTKSVVGAENNASNTNFSPNVTINHAKGRLSATELRENGVSLAEKYALKDEVGVGLEDIEEIDTWAGELVTNEYEGEGVTWSEKTDIYMKNGGTPQSVTVGHRVPITAGAGIEFVNEEDNTVSINATGGAGLENVEVLDMYMGMVEPPQTDDGIYWVEKAQARKGDDSVIKEFNAYHHIPIVSGEGIKFEQNEEQGQVKISTDLPTVKAKLTPASEVVGGSFPTYMDIGMDIVDPYTNETGIHYDSTGNELSNDNGLMAECYQHIKLPITAGTGIEFICEENNTVSINATGGGSGGISGAWTSGTSGSVTLPSAGLYELKTTTIFGLLHTTLYWNGSDGTLASFGGVSGLPAILVPSTGVITTVDPSDLTTPIELTLEYRKIGEA